MARDYTDDGSYWTVRKVGKVYWVARIRKTASGGYRWIEVWGGYERAGAAGGAAAQLAYAQGQRDAANKVRGSLHDALDKIGLGLPMPPRPSIAADPSMMAADRFDDDDE